MKIISWQVGIEIHQSHNYNIAYGCPRIHANGCTQGGKQRSTGLNACRAKEFVVLSSITRWIMVCYSFLFDVPGTFSTQHIK